MVIHLDQHGAAPVRVPNNGTCGGDIATAQRIPSPVASASIDVAPCAIEREFSDDLSTADVDSILRRVYAMAAQI